jgi:hypothetical protein
MPANPNWTRWFFASVASVLKQVAVDASLPVLVEHFDERTADFQEAMGSPIPVWNYGNQPGDYEDSDPTTQEFIGCLLPRSGKDQPVRVFHFGQNQATDKTKQTVVDARYTLYL